MHKIDFDDELAKLSGITIDARGSKVCTSLELELTKLDCINSNCSTYSYILHILNLMFSNSITKYVRSSSIKNANVL